MFTIARIFCFLLVLAAGLRSQTSLENALRAQVLLGDDVWSQVITVRNDTRGGPYPKTVHALVFELVGMLWFYTDTNGTQSFSLRKDELEQEKRDFGPLLLDIDPGFRGWQIVEHQSVRAMRPQRPLLNGCFIESVVALRERLGRGLRTDDASLLSYYAKTRWGVKGHTVLMVSAGDRVEVFDPARPSEQLVFPKAAAGDALRLARTLEGKYVETARYLPLPSDANAEIFVAGGAARSRQANVPSNASSLPM